MPPQASSQPPNPLPHERPVLRWVGLLLHFGLVAILAVLLVVAANGHMEHVVETPLNEFERVSNTISISLLVFITVRRQSGHEYTYLTHTHAV
jgi:cytosine/uracil/thiamine/allantoin permease